MLPEQADRLLAVRRGEDLVAAARQHLADQGANRLLVLGQEHALDAVPLDRALQALDRDRVVLDREWQDDAEGRPLARLGGDGDPAARLLDDSVDGREAEARALPRILGREERLEDVRDGLRIHADTGIAHGQLDLPVDTAHGELDLAARGHCVAGVEHEVRDHLFDLAAVGTHAAAGRHGGRELHVVAQEPRDQSLELLDDVAEIEDLCQEHLVAAEGEQLAGERRGTIGGAHDLQRVCAPRVVVVEAGHEELAVAADRGQEVVEVVRDTAGEPSNRLELLRVQ